MWTKPRPLSAQHRDEGDEGDDDDDDARDRHATPTATTLRVRSPSAAPSATPTRSAAAPSKTTTTLDDALQAHVGELGPAQLRVCLLASLSWASLAMAVLSLVFLAPDPVRSGDWACAPPPPPPPPGASGAPPPPSAAAAAAAAACAALSRKQKEQQQQQAQRPGHSSFSPPLTAQSPEFCALPRDGWLWTDPRASAVAAFDLHCGRAPLATALSSALFAGFVVASPAWGAFSDRSGRRAAALASGWAAAGASLLSAAAPTFPLLLLSRFLVGACVAGLPPSVYPLSVEIAGPKARGRAGVLGQSVYHLGEWLLPLCAWALGDWRRLCVAVAASAALTTLALAAWVPESPRWLLVRGREGEARRALDALARGNNGGGGGLPTGLRLRLYSSSSPSSPSPRVGAKRRQQEGSAAGAGAGAGEAGGGLAALWRHRRSRALLLPSAAATGVAAAAFYVFSLVDGALPGGLSWNFFVTSAAELPFALALAFLIDAWGRRPAVSSFLAAGGLAAAACGLLAPPSSGRASAALHQIVLAAAAKGAVSAAWGGLVTWSAELFSTSLRASALAACNQAARLGGAAAPLIVHVAARAGWPEGQFVAAGAGAVAAAALVWLALPETRGVPQPDSLEDVDAIFGGGSGGGAGGGGSLSVPAAPPPASAAAAAGGATAMGVLRPSSRDSLRSGGWQPLLASRASDTSSGEGAGGAGGTAAAGGWAAAAAAIEAAAAAARLASPPPRSAPV